MELHPGELFILDTKIKYMRIEKWGHEAALIYRNSKEFKDYQLEIKQLMQGDYFASYVWGETFNGENKDGGMDYIYLDFCIGLSAFLEFAWNEHDRYEELIKAEYNPATFMCDPYHPYHEMFAKSGMSYADAIAKIYEKDEYGFYDNIKESIRKNIQRKHFEIRRLKHDIHHLEELKYRALKKSALNFSEVQLTDDLWYGQISINEFKFHIPMTNEEVDYCRRHQQIRIKEVSDPFANLSMGRPHLPEITKLDYEHAVEEIEAYVGDYKCPYPDREKCRYVPYKSRAYQRPLLQNMDIYPKTGEGAWTGASPERGDDESQRKIIPDVLGITEELTEESAISVENDDQNERTIDVEDGDYTDAETKAKKAAEREHWDNMLKGAMSNK